MKKGPKASRAPNGKYGTFQFRRIEQADCQNKQKRDMPQGERATSSAHEKEMKEPTKRAS